MVVADIHALYPVDSDKAKRSTTPPAVFRRSSTPNRNGSPFATAPQNNNAGADGIEGTSLSSSSSCHRQSSARISPTAAANATTSAVPIAGPAKEAAKQTSSA